MLRTLIWKQFYECFKGYFIDSKTGQAKSKFKIFLMFVLLVFILLTISGTFYGLALSFVNVLNNDYSWLYYAIFGSLAIAIGTFAGAFNCSNSLYNAKDNDLLLSLPIKPSYILLSRIVLVMGLTLLYSMSVWFPISLCDYINNGFSYIKLVSSLLIQIFICLFCLVLSCLLGFVISIFSNKTKNKSLISVLLSLIFIGGYYYLVFRFQDFLNNIILNKQEIASTLSTWVRFISRLGKGATGQLSSLIVFGLECVILFCLMYVILSKSFYKIVTSSKNISVSNKKITYQSVNKISSVLLKKEFKRFISTPTYMLNCGLGSIFVLVMAVISLLNKNDIKLMLDEIKVFMPIVDNILPIIIVLIICLIISINTSAVPSISLEGRNLWIIKSLPINPFDILQAKKTLQLLINAIPSLISGAIMSYALNLNYSSSIYVLVLIVMFIMVQSSISILLALVNPNFNWTSETQPIKQSLNVLYEMIICFALLAIIGLCTYRFMYEIGFEELVQYIVIALMILEILLRKALRSWGVEKFCNL